MGNGIRENEPLPYEDQDIYELVEMWPKMPENIKNNIRTTVRAWLESIAPQIKPYLENASRPGQKKFNKHIENNVPRPGTPPKKKPQTNGD